MIAEEILFRIKEGVMENLTVILFMLILIAIPAQIVLLSLCEGN